MQESGAIKMKNIFHAGRAYTHQLQHVFNPEIKQGHTYRRPWSCPNCVTSPIDPQAISIWGKSYHSRGVVAVCRGSSTGPAMCGYVLGRRFDCWWEWWLLQQEPDERAVGQKRVPAAQEANAG